LLYKYTVDVSSSQTKEFIKECHITEKFNHPNIMSLVGVSVVQAKLLMVLPYMSHGDVKSFLKSKRRGKLEITGFPKVNSKVT